MWWIYGWVRAFEHAGPMFIKLGQWISCRSDVLPFKVCKALSSLQSGAKAHDWSYSAQILQSAHFHNGQSVLEACSYIIPHPIGVGAVAQVYQAFLNEPVAIKILHPGVVEQIQVDLSLLNIMGGWIDQLPFGYKYLCIPDEIRVFSKMMLDQTNLQTEKAHLEQFIKNFSASNSIQFPRPLFSNEQGSLLIESFVDGIPLREYLDAQSQVFDKQIAHAGLDGFLQMIFKDNLVHADMHAGNILVRFKRKLNGLFGDTFEYHNHQYTGSRKAFYQSLFDQGYEPELNIIDTGLVSILSPSNLENIQDCFKAGLEWDIEKLVHLFITRCRDPLGVINADEMPEKFRRLVSFMELDGQGRLPLARVYAGDLVQKFASLIRSHHVSMDGDFCGLFVAAFIIEGLGRSLDADLDLLNALVEHIQ